MNFIEFLSPVFRRKKWFLGVWCALVIVFFGIYFVLPSVTKSTIYFTINPVGAPEKNLLVPGVEDAEKIAEAIAGWAKDPGFRNDILNTAGVSVSHFKRKISARKQNRINVFWTLKLSDDERQFSEKISRALVTVLNKNFSVFAKNAFLFEMTPPRISHEPRQIPFLWALMGVILIGGILAGTSIYGFESWTGRVSFYSQLYDRFPEYLVLQVPEKLGQHNERFLEQFILTFESPRLVGTFPEAKNFFSLAPVDSIDDEGDTPIFLVKLGETHLRDLENLVAIFGEEAGVIVFES